MLSPYPMVTSQKVRGGELESRGPTEVYVYGEKPSKAN